MKPSVYGNMCAYASRCLVVCSASHLSSKTAREASWRQAFGPCTPLLFDLYHYLEQNGCFGLVPGKPILSVPGSKQWTGSTPAFVQEAFRAAPLNAVMCASIVRCTHDLVFSFFFKKFKNNMCMYIYIQKKWLVYICVSCLSHVCIDCPKTKNTCVCISVTKKKWFVYICVNHGITSCVNLIAATKIKTCIHVYIYTHKYIYICTFISTYIYMCVCIYWYPEKWHMYVCVNHVMCQSDSHDHINMCIYADIYINWYIYTWLHTYIYMYTYIAAGAASRHAHKQTSAIKHMYIHLYTHAHIHGHIYIYAHTCTAEGAAAQHARR